MSSISLKFNTVDICCITCIEIENNYKNAISSRCLCKFHSLLIFNQRSAIMTLMLKYTQTKLNNGTPETSHTHRSTIYACLKNSIV